MSTNKTSRKRPMIPYTNEPGKATRFAIAADAIGRLQEACEDRACCLIRGQAEEVTLIERRISCYAQDISEQIQ